MTLKQLIAANKFAAQYFQTQLNNNKFALGYVTKRVPKSVADKYKLGYAPQRGLIDYLDKHNVSESCAKEVGLIGKDPTSSGHYEMFRRKIMIPIVHAGWVVGFGGRDLTGKSASKYINSKKSVLYDKSAVLYGLWGAIEYIEQAGHAIVVEGYFDALSLYSVGIKNVVAGCGTAFTEKHANALRMFTDTVYILLDGDAAGQRASGKLRKVLKKKGLSVCVKEIPDELDPDEYVKKHGKAELLKLIGE